MGSKRKVSTVDISFILCPQYTLCQALVDAAKDLKSSNKNVWHTSALESKAKYRTSKDNIGYLGGKIRAANI